jgi:hypothetical protein
VEDRLKNKKDINVKQGPFGGKSAGGGGRKERVMGLSMIEVLYVHE